MTSKGFRRTADLLSVLADQPLPAPVLVVGGHRLRFCLAARVVTRPVCAVATSMQSPSVFGLDGQFGTQPVGVGGRAASQAGKEPASSTTTKTRVR